MVIPQVLRRWIVFDGINALLKYRQKLILDQRKQIQRNMHILHSPCAIALNYNLEPSLEISNQLRDLGKIVHGAWWGDYFSSVAQ